MLNHRIYSDVAWYLKFAKKIRSDLIPCLSRGQKLFWTRPSFFWPIEEQGIRFDLNFFFKFQVQSHYTVNAVICHLQHLRSWYIIYVIITPTRNSTSVQNAITKVLNWASWNIICAKIQVVYLIKKKILNEPVWQRIWRFILLNSTLW